MAEALKNGALGRIRTCDPLVRSQVLYPAELRARVVNLNDNKYRLRGRVL